MIKRTLIMAVLALGFAAADAPQADAYIIRRVAPVRRVAARAVLPPYPIARRAIVRPVYRRPVVAAPVYAAPIYHPAPVYYGTGVSVGVVW